MFCTKCGAEIPAGTEYCPSCGARVGGAALAAGDAAGSVPAAEPAAATGAAPSGAASANGEATPGAVPSAVSESAPVQKKSRKRAAIIGICIVGVLAVGGAALALTGGFGPLGQGNSSKITKIGSDEGSAARKDEGSAQKEPAAKQEAAPEPEQDPNKSTVNVDINDQATYAAANLFLSNFTEEGFPQNPEGGSATFDSTDGLSADEKVEMTYFIYNHLLDNGSSRVETGGHVGQKDHYIDGKSYIDRISIDSVQHEMNRLFGMSISGDEMQIDADEGAPEQLGTRATAQDGYLYLNEEHGSQKLPVPAIVTAAEDLGDNTYRLTFEAYTAKSYNGADMPLITDLPESVYGLPADQLKATIGADSTPTMTGSAVVAVTQGDGAPTFTLQSITYDN